MFTEFETQYQNRHQYAQEWKRKTGGKAVGYICTYVPEEILYAADILPVRILGKHTPYSAAQAQPYIFDMYCPFCRDCLGARIDGEYDYLDGLVLGQSCIHIRQTYFSWVHHFAPEFNYYIHMPLNVVRPSSLPFLKRELLAFKSSLEKWIGREITEDDLIKGIRTVDENRKLMKQVYELRKEEKPRLTGLEAMYMVVASQTMDKREHTKILEDMFEKGLARRELGGSPGTRLMTIGSENDDVEFTKMVEGLDATIVIEDHCTGSRYFWDEVALENEDPLTAIAKRYIQRTPCPQRDWEPERRRFKRIFQFIEEFGVQGVILVQQKFCDPHELDIPALRDLLNERRIKNYFLELDITVPAGQFGTRVEAFLETFTSEELFAGDLY